LVKKAFALIELIVTITIIGLTISIIPMLLERENQAQDQSTLQEAIFAASTKMSHILSYPWDEQSTNIVSTSSTSGSAVLDTNGDSALNRIVGTNFRIGHFRDTGHHTLFTSTTHATTVLGKEGTTTNDMDDFKTTLNGSLLASEVNDYGCKAIYTITVASDYISDTLVSGSYNDNVLTFDFNATAVGTTTNIKKNTITVYDSNNEVQFNLTSFSSNIGESHYLARMF